MTAKESQILLLLLLPFPITPPKSSLDGQEQQQQNHMKESKTSLQVGNKLANSLDKIESVCVSSQLVSPLNARISSKTVRRQLLNFPDGVRCTDAGMPRLFEPGT